MIAAAQQAVASLATPDRHELDMPGMIAALRGSGLLAACAPDPSGQPGLAHTPRDPEELHDALMAIGEADLSAGRLFEGHVNAVKLIDLLARGDARKIWLDAARAGALFGVWGAEGPAPVAIRNNMLTGEKLFASGADVIDYAVVTARDPDGQLRLLVLSRAALDGRLYPEEWDMSGMQATASGRCVLDGIEVGGEALLGGPDDYFTEPHFQGGVWRYAAVQTGALRAMMRATAGQLHKRGQIDDPLQSDRLRRMATICETCRMWNTRAARAVEAPDAPPQTAAIAMIARLHTAREAAILMGLMDDALGAASFAKGHPVERPRRDLQVYLRQAAPDALGRRALTMLLEDPSMAADWALA